jgi:hypothetical protein
MVKKRKSRARSKYLISIVEPGHGAIDVCYLGHDWGLARASIDEARSNVKWRGYELRMVTSLGRKVLSIKKGRIT